MNINPRKETKSHTKNNAHSKESVNRAKFLKEYVDSILKRVQSLEDAVVELQVKKIGELERVAELTAEIIELKAENHYFNRALKYLRFCIVILTLPILWDVLVKIVKLFA